MAFGPPVSVGELPQMKGSGVVIIPMGSEELASATDQEIITAYLGLGFDQGTAEAYLYMLGRGPDAGNESSPTGASDAPMAP